jgi:uncharacterized protein (DUF1800 family)
MLYYLDNYINTQAGPNENWARELFELHGIGAENYYGAIANQDVPGYPSAPQGYCDFDVYSAADCFTGWGVDDRWGNDSDPRTWGTGVFTYTDAEHDANSPKIVLGRTIQPFGPAEGDGKTVLDLIANHPGTARYIARRMCRRLISDDVDEATVQAVADVFYANRTAPDQIAKTVRAIATSSAFANSYALKVRRPYEAMIAALRTTNAQLNLKPVLKTGVDAQGKTNAWWDDPMFHWSGLNGAFEACGQPMFQRRPPDGWPDRIRNWTGTTGMLFRWKLMYFIADAGTAKDRRDIRTDFLGETTAAVPVRTAANVVDYWIARCVNRPMPAASRDELIKYLGKGSTAALNFNDDAVKRRLALMVSLIMSSPEFNWR